MKNTRRRKNTTKQGKGSGKRTWVRILIMIGLIVLIIAAFVTVVIMSLRQPVFQIEGIKVITTEVVHERDIAKQTQSVLSSTYPLRFPKDSWVLYPRKEIKEQILGTFPRVKDVRLNLKRFSILEVSISEWQPTFLWCVPAQKKASIESPATSSEKETATTSSSPVTTTQPDYGDCRFMAENGHIFGKAPMFSSGVYLVWYPTKEKLAKQLRENTEERVRYFENVMPVIEKLEDRYELTISSVGIAPHNDIQLGIERLENIRTPHATLLFNTDTGTAQLIDNMSILLRNKTFTKKLESATSSLEYIDLRFDDQLLFKYQ